jgi:DNA-directed RNA polymerase subunit RPC12/RpoP
LASLNADNLWTAPTVPVLLNRLRNELSRATMRTRIYVAGTEGFIGLATQEALAFGVDHNSLRTEHRGSEARRVQCVHCKGITENVTTSPVKCSHCGLHLLVRDHYSRRIAAFQGVCIDAEEPGSVPPPEELFP